MLGVERLLANASGVGRFPSARTRFRHLNADTQDDWPSSLSHLLGTAPRIAKLIGYLFQRIASFRRDESLRLRPRSKVANQMIEVPLCLHFKCRWINLVKREVKIGKLLDKLALRRPERADHIIVVSIYNLIDRRVDA
jgi:hypothetical protein